MTRRVILAGGGHAHLAVLADWARRPWPGTIRKLIASSRHTAYSGMLPGWMAGIYRADELLIDLAPLAERAGAELVLADVVGLNPARRTLQLSTGQEAAFDLLSLATGGETDVSALSALGERLLPVRPVDRFMDRWTGFVDSLSAGASPVVAVVGGGAGGVELALGASAALRRACPAARVLLVARPEGILPDHDAKVRKLAQEALAQRGIALKFGIAAGHPDGLALSDGQVLAADFVIAATGSTAPRWLAGSGLACTAGGYAAVGANLKSPSHPAIFAAGDIAERIDRPLARSGVHAVKAGPVLADNLRAALAGAPLQDYQPAARTLYLLSLGNRRAIASWGGWGASGRLAWWLKDRIDRSFVARYSHLNTAQGTSR